MIVVPTLHPAALLRGRDEESGLAKFEQTTIADIAKALRLTRERPRWDERVIWERDSVGRLKNLFPTPEEVIEFCRNALGHPVATDVESTGEQVMAAQLMCGGFASANGTAMCVPFLKRGGSRYWAPHDEARVRWAVGQLLASRDTTKIIHNKSFDETVYWLNGLPVAGRVEDTLQAHHVIDSELPHALGFCGTRYLDTRYWKDDVKGDEGWLYLDDEILRAYNLRDCISTRELFPIFQAELAKMGPRSQALYEQEMRITSLMARATVRGIGVDFWRRDCETASIPIYSKDGKSVMAYQKGLGPRLRDQMNSALVTLRQLAGTSAFDPMKPVQLKELLFSRLRFPIVKMSESGLHPSTDKEAMVLLALAAGTVEQKGAIKALADFKSAQKGLSTFVDGLKITGDGRFHPTWKALTTTGRLASSPNAQNFSTAIKQIFCAGEPRFGPDKPTDWEFSGVDLSQAELRSIAYFANDPNLLTMYQRGINVHTVNAGLLFRVRPDAGHKDLDAVTESYLRNEAVPQLLKGSFDTFSKMNDGAWKGARTLAKNFEFGCLEASTQVALLNGSKPICEVQPGDWTWCWANEQYTPTKVKRAWSKGRMPCVRVVMQEQGHQPKSVVVTADHRMLLRSGAYKPAGELQPNDRLMPPFRRYTAAVVSVWPCGEHEVWDLEVEHPAHNFALEKSVFVSNSAYGAEDDTKFEVLRSKRDPATNELLFPLLRRSEVEATSIIWKRLRPYVIKYWATVQAEIKTRGYGLCPISGRVRWFRGGFKRNEMLNWNIQTSIASFMNERMLEIQDIFDRETGGSALVVQQVHDSLNSENLKGYSKRAAEVMRDVLSRPIALPGHPQATFPPDKVLHGSHLDKV